jgi:glucose-6-phosphate isomerase
MSKLKQLALTSATLTQLFQQDPQRAQHFTIEAAGLSVDFSRTHINHEVLAALEAQAQTAQLAQWRGAMFQGEAINNTEHRAVLHTALRQIDDTPLFLNGHDIIQDIREVQQKMADLVNAVHEGIWTGYSGARITDVVNIGIGGSDLGPRMATYALKPYHTDRLRCHFIANVDGSDISDTLAGLNPATTLFIVASKTFTTQETLMNATTARQWIVDAAGDPASVAKHFIAISSHVDRVQAFGIDPKHCLQMWDWVGGRYSLWSAIGLPIALAVGMAHFLQLLAGANAMDQHFYQAPLRANAPALAGLIGAWYHNDHGTSSHAILPYDQHLALLPDYLQQADMESNGKSVHRDGSPVPGQTGPVIWGNIGTNGQHAFHQLLHQGTQVIPVDFILPLKAHHHLAEHHHALAANCLAQAQALMCGKNLAQAKQELRDSGYNEREADALAAHKVIAGNKPSTMIYCDQLTATTLGALIAFYEHKIFTQGILWGINSFDQWGVELGKQLSKPILQAIRQGTALEADSATQKMIALLCEK